MLQSNPCQHPVIILQDTHFSELESLLCFVYKGEVNIDEENLPALLRAAETLQIRGLAGASEQVQNEVCYFHWFVSCIAVFTFSVCFYLSYLFIIIYHSWVILHLKLKKSQLMNHHPPQNEVGIPLLLSHGNLTIQGINYFKLAVEFYTLEMRIY